MSSIWDVCLLQLQIILHLKVHNVTIQSILDSIWCVHVNVNIYMNIIVYLNEQVIGF